MTPSGGIFQSYQGGAIGIGNPTTRPRIQEQISQDVQRQALDRLRTLQETMRIAQLQQDIPTQRAPHR